MYNSRTNDTGERYRRLKGYPAYWVVLLVGLIAFLIALILYLTKISFGAVISCSIGGSLIATSIAAWIIFQKRELGEEIYGSGVTGVFVERRRDIRGEVWSEMIRRAKHECNILGIALHGWATDDATARAIEECVARGVAINMVFLDPESQAAVIRRKEEKGRNTRQAIAESVVRFWEIREGLPKRNRSKLRLWTYSKTPSCAITWSDSYMIVSNYVVAVDNVYSPGFMLWDVSPATDLFVRVKIRKDKRCLFDVYRDDFNAILKASKRVTTPRIQRYRTKFLRD